MTITDEQLRALEELEAKRRADATLTAEWDFLTPADRDRVYGCALREADALAAAIASARAKLGYDEDWRALYETIGLSRDETDAGKIADRIKELVASARRVVELEAEREAMQLEIDQGREAREMMNDSIDALQSRLAAAEAENARLLADNIRAHEALAPALRRLAAAEKVVEAAKLFRDRGTVLTSCDRGACQQVIEEYDRGDPQAQMFDALAAYDRTAGATDADGGGK